MLQPFLCLTKNKQQFCLGLFESLYEICMLDTPKKANVVKKTVRTDKNNGEIGLHDSVLRIRKCEVIHQLRYASMATGIARTYPQKLRKRPEVI